MSKGYTPFELITDLLISCSILCFHTLLAQVALARFTILLKPNQKFHP